MVEGVKNGYSKELQIKGVGYRAEMKGEDLVLKVGFSHLVEIKKIEGVEFSVNKDIITVSGIKKQLVNNVAADIRKVRRPDPYKGKGIRYKDEVIVLKEGKKSVK
jgi:large subunit ribosomal protein L6